VAAAELLGELVARAEEDELLASMNDDFRELRDHEPSWRLLKSERSAWEQTLLDGLTHA